MAEEEQNITPSHNTVKHSPFFIFFDFNAKMREHLVSLEISIVVYSICHRGVGFFFFFIQVCRCNAHARHRSQINFIV